MKFEPKRTRKYFCPNCGELLIKVYPWSKVILEEYGKGLMDEAMMKFNLQKQGKTENQIKKELNKRLAIAVCGKCQNNLAP